MAMLSATIGGNKIMKLIKDIRLFELDVPNIDGNDTPYYIGKIYEYDSMDCLDVIQRLLFLLRHRTFGFDIFDHLYVNFTRCVPHGEVRDVNRYNIREFSWYHYVDAGCDPELFNAWDMAAKTAFVLEAVRKAVLLMAPEDQRTLFTDSFDEVLQKGECLLLPHKRKENADHIVEVFVRINDELDFIPMIRVTDRNNAVVAEQTLRSYGRDEFISQIGTISIGKRSARITPRKNWDTEYYDLAPIKITW